MVGNGDRCRPELRVRGRIALDRGPSLVRFSGLGSARLDCDLPRPSGSTSSPTTQACVGRRGRQYLSIAAPMYGLHRARDCRCIFLRRGAAKVLGAGAWRKGARPIVYRPWQLVGCRDTVPRLRTSFRAWPQRRWRLLGVPVCRGAFMFDAMGPRRAWPGLRRPGRHCLKRAF